MKTIGLSEWMWRFLALAMVFVVGWMVWVLYQLNPPPLIMNAAFEAFASAKAKGNQLPKPGAQGMITTAPAAPGTAEPAKPVPAAAPPAAEPAKPAAETPVAAKPNPAEIIDTVEAWARAWSSKDVTAYLGFYAGNFQTPGGEPRAEWEKSRRQRISAPKSITITIDAPVVSFPADELANVTFRQGYRSDIITSSPTTKTLALARIDGRWLILKETSGN